MTKVAHITSAPEYEVGDRVLALCGKDFKVKVLWDDLPDDKPICRSCVDVAVTAMTEADAMIVLARRYLSRMKTQIVALSETMEPEDFYLDVIAENEHEFAERESAKAELAAAAELAKSTCLCTWTDAQTRVTNPDCPIHGDERPPVAPPEDPGHAPTVDD